MWPSHALEYYSARKRHEVLIGATAWMNPNTNISESSRTQKATYLLSASISRKSPEQANVCAQEADEWLPGDYGGWGGVGDTAGGGSGE